MMSNPLRLVLGVTVVVLAFLSVYLAAVTSEPSSPAPPHRVGVDRRDSSVDNQDNPFMPPVAGDRGSAPDVPAPGADLQDSQGAPRGLPEQPQKVPVDPSGLTSRQALLDKQRMLLRDGTIAIDVPKQMTVDEDMTVKVTVAGATPPADFPTVGPNLIIEQGKVGSDLQADLTGMDFNITRVGTDDGRRTLATDSSAHWEWQVRPQSSGPHTLFIQLYVRVTDDTNSPPIDVKSFQKPVDVAVNPTSAVAEFFKTYWAATGLSVPIIVAAAVAVVRARRSANSRTGPAADRSTPERRLPAVTRGQTAPRRRPPRRPPARIPQDRDSDIGR